MALETSTYLNGLTPSWPTASDPKSQGDDHLRLLKGALQATFPNATGPMYFPTASTQTSGVIPAASQNQTLFYDTTGGSFAITLPVSPPAGWSCDVLKYTNDQNAITVSPPSGSIFTAVGGVATVRVGACGSLAHFMWNGSAWFCSKHGPLVGSTVYWDGPTMPAGHLRLDGTAFSGTTFAELALALGGTTLRDKRGRVEAGVDTATGLLGAQVGSGANGQVGGLFYQYLTTTQMPVHRHAAAIYDPTHQHGYTDSSVPGGQKPAGTGTAPFAGTQGGTTTPVGTGVRVNSDGGLDTTYTAGGGDWHPNVQPTIITDKLIRAC